MSAKLSKTRREAFLRALAQTGNQTIAAERAKVSRSWACAQRAKDAGFDAACREAIETAAVQQAERARREQTPPAGWRFQDGAELVVSGSNDGRKLLQRARPRQWTRRSEERFLAALAASCNIEAAAAAAGLHKSSAYKHRKRNVAFARAWDEAIAIGTVRLEAAVIENFDHYFDPDTPPPEMPMNGISIMSAIRMLQIYQRRR